MEFNYCHVRQLYFHVLLLLACGFLLFGKALGPATSTSMQQLQMRDKVLEMFSHAYQAYMKNAYPADELMPIACKGRVRGITPSRGDIDDVLGNFSLTLVDTLDTLAVLGFHDEFEEAVKKVEKDVRFETDVTVSVFETIIRVLGGLLGGHSAALELQQVHGRMPWYNGSLLNLAKELGDRLLPAFNTTSGMPLSRINLHTMAVRKDKDRDTCTACAGTMLLEMAALSRFTGDPIYESCARRAMDYLWSRRQRSSDLMGTVLNVENGEWLRKESGIGAGIDSYYEYLLKAYILLGDETYLYRFNTHYLAIKQYVAQGPLLVDVLMHKPTTSAKNFVDALSAFWPGLQVLKGDVKSAIETHELLYQVFTRHTFLPEAFTTSFDIHWGQYPLRPEFAESTYLLYKATGDPYYIEVGKTIVENLERHARVDCGYAGIKDVRTFKHEDRMDSYFLAEMFKYLYLLFTPKSEQLGIDIENYILTTEAHILPLKLSIQPPRQANASYETVASPMNAEENFERSCASTVYVQYDNLHATEELRKKISIVQGPGGSQCQKSPTQDDVKNLGRPRQLRASEFVPGNQRHTDILRKMGISMVVMTDGKVQLVQQQNRAVSVQDATEGAIFMHEMMELSKSGSLDSNPQPVYAQLISMPYLGAIALKGGPAQFGPNLEKSVEVSAEAVFVEPFHSCTTLSNPADVKNKIAIATRGQCMFINKAKMVEEAGGVGIVIIDNHSDTSFDTSAPFAMAGDEKTTTNIPAVFLFHKEGIILKNCVDEQTRKGLSTEILLTSNAKSLEELVLQQRFKDREEAGDDTASDQSNDTTATDSSEDSVSDIGPSVVESPPTHQPDVGENTAEPPTDHATSAEEVSKKSDHKSVVQKNPEESADRSSAESDKPPTTSDALSEKAHDLSTDSRTTAKDEL